MSWHFSQALVAAFSGERSSGGEPSAPSSLTPMPAMCWLPGRTTDAFRPSRSGMTCEPLTADRGAELLTWCLGVSRAKTFPPLARAPESAAPALDSGERWHALLVKFDPASCGWKTARCLWEEGLDWSCLTLPRWGSLRDGELWERATPGLPTRERESGFLPTPRAGDVSDKAGCAEKVGNAIKRKSGEKFSISLATMAHRNWWPTPCASEARQGLQIRREGKKGTQQSLSTAVIFATPQARDFRTGQQSRWENPKRTRNLNDQIGGQLNPTWVEWLMGWPLGWTDCAASATAKYQEWLQWHGGF
jgi:hypothetical protein